MVAWVGGATLVVAAMIPGMAVAALQAAPAVDPAVAPGPAAPPAAVPPGPEAPASAASPAPDPSAAPPATAVPVSAPEPGVHWELFGFLRLQYLVVQDDPDVAFVGRDDGFELQNARVGVHGRLAPSLGFVVAFDGAVDERLQVNTTDGKLRVGLRDAFADLGVGALTIRGGLFQAVVDPEALVADTQRAFVDHPIESRGVRPTQGFQAAGLPPGRSLGAAIRIDPTSFGGRGRPGDDAALAVGFELAVQNGADELASNNDNDKPAVSATLLARLPHDGWAMLAGRYNPRTTGTLPVLQDEDDLQGVAGFGATLGPLAINGGAIVQRTFYATTDGPSQDAFGGHIQAMLALPLAVPLAVGYRFGMLDPSSLLANDRVMEHAVGAVLGVPRYRMRVQLQVTHVVDQRDLSNDRAQLAAELAL